MTKPSRAKGTRDFLPQDMRQRQHVIATVRSVFERYGYEPMETPALERWDVLKGKLGEESEQLLFAILRRGGPFEDLRMGKCQQVQVNDFNDVVDLALRYDLTVPFSRVLAMHPELPKPFKRYQIQPVWRADRPQKGRFREFYQCDVDIAGSTSMVADAEIIAIKHDALCALGFSKFRIRLNHRKLLNGLVASAGGESHFGSICIAIDKLDKIGRDGVMEELQQRGVAAEVCNKVFDAIQLKGSYQELLPQLEALVSEHPEGQQGLKELGELYNALHHLGVAPERIPLDLALVRGLDYYTGPIFETAVDEPNIGSLGGGGRYDGLIEKFSGAAIPATGGSLGLERIIVVMEELGMFDTSMAGTQLLVTVFQPDLVGASLEFAQVMRNAGVRTEIYLNPTVKMQKQIRYAGEMNIPVIAIIGPDEANARNVTLRISRDQQATVSFEDAPQQFQQMLQDARKLQST